MRFYNIVTQTQSQDQFPEPVGLVVKKGWKILSLMEVGMPLPLSETRISTPPLFTPKSPEGDFEEEVLTMTVGLYSWCFLLNPL